MNKAQIESTLQEQGVTTLLKFVDKPEYAQSLLAGNVRMQAVGNYARSYYGDGRDDLFEGHATSSIRAVFDHAIFCMTAPPDNDVDGFLFDSVSGLEMRMKFARHGAVCVIEQPEEFIWRLQEQTGPLGFGLVSYDGDLFAQASLPSKPYETLFHKNRAFACQHEFRIATGLECLRDRHREYVEGRGWMECPDDAFGPCIAHIGDLSDIARTIRLAD